MLGAWAHRWRKPQEQRLRGRRWAEFVHWEVVGDEAGKFRGGGCLFLVPFEVWLRCHLLEACLILSALGTSRPCHTLPVAGRRVSGDGYGLLGRSDWVLLIWVSEPLPSLLCAQSLVQGPVRLDKDVGTQQLSCLLWSHSPDVGVGHSRPGSIHTLFSCV